MGRYGVRHALRNYRRRCHSRRSGRPHILVARNTSAVGVGADNGPLGHRSCAWRFCCLGAGSFPFHSFSFALRAELKDTGVTVTCLMPGATETDFFERADMMDTKVGTAKKDDPADVAKTGFEAMMTGEGDVVTGWHNKLQSAIASITPAGMLAERHRKMAAPGSAE
jgi:NAD(P)-dependent dehydrogenase (short-subunit alcohol dehydrogenase family)